jgi:HD-GYP domain-containing protein (c-di-GMP phosphodiesterase class II)
VRLIPCRKISDGVELARDVVTGPPGTAPLLRAGVRLSERYATLLPKAGVGSVWIEDDLGADIDVVEPLAPETRARVYRATGDALQAAGDALRSGSGMPSAVVDSLTDVAGAMVADLLDSPDAALSLHDLAAFDSYTHRHSVQVTVLGLLIARRAWRTDGWIDYRGRRRRDRLDERLRKLGLGLLVHDIGKLSVPPEVLNKPGPLTDEERPAIERHPLIGEGILSPIEFLSESLPLVRAAHERWDGAGYPDQLAGAAIPAGSRIIAVCDAFDAMRSERSYQPRRSVGDALAELRRCAGTQFDPAVVTAFAAVMADELAGLARSREPEPSIQLAALPRAVPPTRSARLS